MKKWNISRVPLQGRPLLLPWITWASAKCQLSGLLREAGAGLEKPPLWPFREPRELTGNWRGGTGGNRAMPAPWWAFQLLWYHLSTHYFFHCEVVHSNFSGSLLCNRGVCVCVCEGELLFVFLHNLVIWILKHAVQMLSNANIYPYLKCRQRVLMFTCT